MNYRILMVCMFLCLLLSSSALAATDVCNEYFEKKEYDKAVEECTRWIASNDGDRFHIALHFRIRGNANSALGKFDEAIADYSKAIELNPNYDLAFYNRGNAYGAKGNAERAIADYTRSIELHPRDYALYNRGTTYAQTGQFALALADFSRAIEFNPAYYLAYTNRGYAYSATGNIDQAIADYSKAIEMNPSYDIAFYNRGNAYNLKGNIDQAVADYYRSAELNPHNNYAFFNLALVFASRNRGAESCSWLKKGVDNGFSLWEEVKHNRGFDTIRQEPCYQEIMAGK